MRKILLIVVLTLVVVPATLFADSGQHQIATFKPFTLQLKWRHAFQFAGFYAADLKGFYKDAGLDVTIKQRVKKIAVVDNLLDGLAEYSLASGATLLSARLQGKPVRGLAVIFQHSPLILLSRADAGLQNPADYSGRSVMRSKSLTTLELDAMFIHEGVDPKTMEMVNPTWNLDALIAGEVDAVASYLTVGPYKLRRQGVEPSSLRPINYGVDFYGDTLFTLEEEVKENPERVVAFTQASMKGWDYAFAHKEEIIAYILTLPGVRERGLDVESLRYEAKEMQRLIQPELVEIGHINPGRFKRMADVFVEQGLAAPDYDLGNFIFFPNRQPQKQWSLLFFGAVGGIFVIGTISWLVNRQLTRVVAERTKKYKESEQRFIDLVTLLPEMVWESDLKGTLTYVNQATFDSFGYDQEYFENGVNYLDMLVPEERKRAADALAGMMKEGGREMAEYIAVASDGRRFPIWINSAVVVKEGVPVGMRGVIVDVSDRRKLEEQLSQAQKMEAIGTLAGGIAHDFNNILAAIMGYAELAAMFVDNPQKMNSYLEHIKKGTVRAKELVAQILTFSRKSKNEVTVIEPHLVVKEALKLLRSSIPSTVTIKCDLKSNGKVKADPTQIHQVVMNLCTNAVQAMEEKGQLTVVLKELDLSFDNLLPMAELPKGRYLCLEIGDTGGGIDLAVQKKIFEPYFTTKNIGQGTGLGLAVVHGIVEACGGQITVYSELGKGTVFRVYLPLVADDGNTIRQAVRKDDLVNCERDQGQGEQILVVDDEKELLTLLTEFLVKSGYRVRTFTDGNEALSHVEKDPYAVDLVITDMTMPKLTGLQLSQKLLAVNPDLPIVLMTGFSTLVDRDIALTVGIREYVSKPLNMGSLLPILRTLLPSKKN
jgi:PAS domain S-box-containing protein